MTTFKQTFLLCDSCHEEFDMFATYAASVRAEAKNDGWRVNEYGGGQDICPSCLDSSTSDRTEPTDG